MGAIAQRLVARPFCRCWPGSSCLRMMVCSVKVGSRVKVDGKGLGSVKFIGPLKARATSKPVAAASCQQRRGGLELSKINTLA